MGQDKIVKVAHVIAAKVQVLWAIRVSRYKFDASYTAIPGYKVYTLQWSGPGLSPVTKLSWVQEQKQNL